MNKGRRQKLKSSYEYDQLSCWKNVMCVFHNTSISKKLKRQMNRRFRREGKRELQEEIE